jgi:hypothetical protein
MARDRHHQRLLPKKKKEIQKFVLILRRSTLKKGLLVPLYKYDEEKKELNSQKSTDYIFNAIILCDRDCLFFPFIFFKNI